MLVVLVFSIAVLGSLHATGLTQTRVLGGSPTTIEQYPILAQLLLDTWGNQKYSQYCAGVIITARHVISTAHCFQYNSNTGRNYSHPKFWKIRVGSSYRSGGGSLHSIKHIVLHKGFDSAYHYNDISVLAVTKPFTMSGNVRQATIPKYASEVKDEAMCTLLGWGVTETAGKQPDQLQYVNLQTINQGTCKTRYDQIGADIQDSMICAGWLDQGGIDGCYGDSGGPLVYNGLVVGLMSFGYTCGHSFYPGVYTKISYFTDWVVKVVSFT